jgi:hypothetical protein
MQRKMGLGYIYILSSVGAIVAFSSLAGCGNRPGPAAPADILFAPKRFYEDDTFGRVYVAGTLTGPGVGYKNNTYAITCYKERGQCLGNGIYHIGANQIGRLDSPTEYEISKWNSYEIVASDPDSPVQCTKTTISILRKSKTVVWVQEPVNQTNAICKDSDTILYKWTLEDPEWNKKRP